MDSYVQLELFDLKLYTSEQPSETKDMVKSVEEIQQSSIDIKIDVNLYSSKIHVAFLGVIKLAA